VPIVWKFWKPQLPGALKVCPGLQWDSCAWLLLFQFNGQQKMTGVSNMVRGVLIVSLDGKDVFEKCGFKMFQ